MSLLILGAIAGLVVAIVGVAMMVAAAMSDSPSAGEAAGKRGCIVLAIGLALLVGCILALVF